MARLLAIASAALALIAAATAVRAEVGDELRARAPKTVATLLPWCAANARDCRALIGLVDLDNIAEGPSPGACVIGTRDAEAATKSILDWLATHPETHAGPAEAGIGAAINALWPC
jgi:hypothetical protein